MKTITYTNPHNGHIATVGPSTRVLTFLFGAFYFLIRGMFGQAAFLFVATLLVFASAPFTHPVMWLCMLVGGNAMAAYLAPSLIATHLLRRGFVASNPPSTTPTPVSALDG